MAAVGKNETPVDEEIKVSLEFKTDRLIFKTELGNFSLDRDTASFLFGREVAVRFERLCDESDDWGELESLESIVKYQFLTGEQDFSFAQAAQAIGFSLDFFKRWVSRRCNTFAQRMAQDPGAVKSILEKLRQEYPKEEPPPKKPIVFDVRRVAKLLIDELGPRQIAESLGMDYSVFYPAWTQNMKYIMAERDRILENKRLQDVQA